MYAPRFYLTGRYRLSPRGDLVVLQVQERTKYPQAPQDRWRDATPQDVMSVVNVDVMSSVLRLSAE
ncbi:hypothetical protein CTI14_00355 [Methylobacterium radiotolerans]|nr:hypothetical protein CTI14_00355 [Methylobacterium radiotolerans]